MGAEQSQRERISKHPRGRTPYGYRKNGTEHRVKGANVALIFERFLAKPNIAEIAKTLSFTSPSGIKWTRMSVRKILINPVYTGTAFFDRIIEDATASNVAAILAKRLEPPRKRCCVCGAVFRPDRKGRRRRRCYDCRPYVRRMGEKDDG
jgi:hypothetical protein